MISPQKDEVKMISGFEKIKNLFKSNNSTSVGIDVGSDNIKIVELEKKDNKIFLKNYAIVRTKRDLIKAGTQGVISNFSGEIIQKTLKESGIKPGSVSTAVPSFASLVTMIELPYAPEEEIEQIMSLEAPKYIPVPLNDVVFGWQIVTNDENKKENFKADDKKAVPVSFSKIEPSKGMLASKSNVKVLLVAVMKEITKQYENVFNANGLAINFLEIDAFSIIRALIGDDKGTYAIIDIGGKVCTVIIASNGNLIFTKTIDIAGRRITETIARMVNVDFERAEKMKREKGLDLGGELKSNPLETLSELLLAEIKKSIENFRSKNSSINLDGIILSGGGSKISGFKDYLAKQLALKVIVGNPWSKIIYPPKLQSTLLENGPFFSIAIGLALLGLKSEN